MAQGAVHINELNAFQTPLPAVEKKFLFVGVAPSNQLTWQTLNVQSDFDTIFGSATSALKTQLIAARLNAGEGWSAYAISHDVALNWLEAIVGTFADMSTLPAFEGIIICNPFATSEDFADLPTHIATIELLGSRCFFIAALPGIDAETQTWSDYKSACSAIIAGVMHKRIAVVPLACGSEIGILAGRLARRDVSVADSPMRVATGAIVGLEAFPVDQAGKRMSFLDLKDLDELKMSVPQIYLGYDGIYWGDCNMLDEEGGDYTVIENLRVVDKAARRLRVRGISRIADRKLNGTPVSIAANQLYFRRDLIAMSKGFVFNGETFPGDIKPPKDDAITITWTDKTHVIVSVKLSPYNSPKDIEFDIGLDLSIDA